MRKDKGKARQAKPNIFSEAGDSNVPTAVPCGVTPRIDVRQKSCLVDAERHRSVADLCIYLYRRRPRHGHHLQRRVSRCFAAELRRQVRRSMPSATFQSLVVTLVLSMPSSPSGAEIDFDAF